jgi:hypothetical protein
MQVLLVVVPLASLMGCNGQPEMPRDMPNALSKEDQVRLAVFEDWLTRYEGLLKQPTPPAKVPCYLAVEAEGKVVDPEQALMAALTLRPFPVKKGSLCIKQGFGVVDKETGKTTGGYLLTVGSIKWVGPNVAELTFEVYQNSRGASWQAMRVLRQDGGWKTAPVGLKKVA